MNKLLFAIGSLIYIGLIHVNVVAETIVERAAIPVRVEAVNIQERYRIPRFYAARVDAQKSIAISSELAGKILSIEVDEGSRVSSGDPLVTLDTELLEAQKSALEAQKVATKADIALNDKRLKRQGDLNRQSFSSEDSIDALEAQRDRLAATLTSLDAQISDIDIRLQKSVIRAPFSGAVQSRFLDEGAVVNAGTPVLQLTSIDDLEVLVGLPTNQVKQLQETSNDVSRFDFEMDEQILPSKLAAVFPEVNPITQTQGVKFTIANTNQLVPGDFVKLKLYNTFSKRGFWISNTALVEGPRGLWEVFVVGSDQQVYKQNVSIIYASNPKSYITSNLGDGDLIVSEGVHRLSNNRKVDVVSNNKENTN